MAKNIVIVLNDGPYGSERTYNGLRVGLSLLPQAETTVRVFLLGDAVQCAVSDQLTPQGYYNIERMIRSLAERGAVATCTTCANARGIGPDRLTEGVEPASLQLLAEWLAAADQVLVF